MAPAFAGAIVIMRVNALSILVIYEIWKKFEANIFEKKQFLKIQSRDIFEKS